MFERAGEEMVSPIYLLQWHILTFKSYSPISPRKARRRGQRIAARLRGGTTSKRDVCFARKVRKSWSWLTYLGTTTPSTTALSTILSHHQKLAHHVIASSSRGADFCEWGPLRSDQNGASSVARRWKTSEECSNVRVTWWWVQYILLLQSHVVFIILTFESYSPRSRKKTWPRPRSAGRLGGAWTNA